MKRIIKSCLIFICACSEPYQFDISESQIDVIEGKITTTVGESYIKAYTLIDNSDIQTIIDLNVSVETDAGETFSFVFDDIDRYKPQDPSFFGEVGKRYRMRAISNNGAIYESSYDIIEEPLNFSLTTNDTTVLSLTSANILVDSKAVAAVAVVPMRDQSVYGRFKFKYSYFDYFTGEVQDERFDKQYALYSCANESTCPGVSVPIGLTTKDQWFFYDARVPNCSFIPCGTGLQCTDDPVQNCLNNPCCEYQDNWQVEFTGYFESMSIETYNFWEDLERLRNNDGLVFDTYPFPLRGNISCSNCDNEVVGLFSSVAVSSAITTRSL